MSRMEMCSYSYFLMFGFFWGPYVSFILRQMSFQQFSQRLIQGLMSHELTAYFSDYQKDVNQISITELSKT